MKHVQLFEDFDENSPNYGGKGPFELPESHKAGMAVPKGGSHCGNCEYYHSENNGCKNEFWRKWAGKTDENHEIPVPGDEYCCDWYEPDDEQEVTELPEGETGS